METNIKIRIFGMAGFIILILLAGACGVNRIVVDVKFPPKYTFSSEITHLALISRITDSLSVPDNIQKPMVLDGGLKKGAGGILIEDQILKGMQNELAGHDLFRVVGKEKIFSTDTLPLFPKPVDPFKIMKIGKTFLADAVFSIESVQVTTSDSSSSFVNKFHESQNKIWSNSIVYDIRDVTYHNATLEVVVQLHWRIYSTVDGLVLFEGVFPDTVTYEVRGNSREDARRKLPSYVNAIGRAGYHAGSLLAKTISPNYETVLRFYYRGAAGDMREAVPLVKFRKWDEASAVWEKAMKSKNKKYRAMASYKIGRAHV